MKSMLTNHKRRGYAFITKRQANRRLRHAGKVVRW